MKKTIARSHFFQLLFINLIFLIALVLFITVTSFMYSAVFRFTHAYRYVLHTYKVIQSIHDLRLNAVILESLTRAYFATGEDSFLNDYNQIKNNIEINVQHIQKLTINNPVQQNNINSIKVIINDNTQYIHNLITSNKNPYPNTPVLLQAIVKLQNYSNSILNITNTMLSIENVLLFNRNENALSNIKNANFIITTAGMISLLFLSILVILYNIAVSRQNLAYREKFESELFLKNLLNNSSELILAIDKNYIVTYINQSFQHDFKMLYGIQLTTGMDYILTHGSTPEHQKYVKKLWDRAFSGEAFSCISEFGDQKIKRSTYEVSFNPIYDNQGHIIGACALCKNVQQRIDQEKSLKETNTKLAFAFDKLGINHNKTLILNDLGKMLQTCNTIEEAVLLMKNHMENNIPNTNGVIYLMNASKNYLEETIRWGKELINIESIFSPNDCWAIRNGKFYLNNSNNIYCKHINDQFFNSYCMPLIAQSNLIGFIELFLKATPIQSETDIKRLIDENNLFLDSMISEFAMAMANIQLRESLKNRSIRDPLTGLYNRGYLDESLERDLNRARRKGLNIAVVMIDIDYFKNINDKFGHDAGDFVLQELGKILIKNTRMSDIACRYGGDEFVIIIYEIDEKEAYEKMDELRQEISSMELKFHDRILDTIQFLLVSLFFLRMALVKINSFIMLISLYIKQKKRGVTWFVSSIKS